MKKLLFLSILLILYSSTTKQACANKTIKINKDIQLVPIQDSVYIHLTFENTEKYGRFSSNGLIYIKNGKALMLDTPMDNEKTAIIAKYLKDSMKVEIHKLIIGHFHDDCLGGLEFIQKQGIESIANERTISKCKELDIPVPSKGFNKELTLNFEGEKVICNFFGAGHSPDNSTVYFPSKRILFGGCLVKSMQSGSLGNLSDAVPDEWDQTIKKLIKTYPDIETVIPGHGKYGGAELLNHTIDLVENYRTNEAR